MADNTNSAICIGKLKEVRPKWGIKSKIRTNFSLILVILIRNDAINQTIRFGFLG
jgi:hypothetical protein